MLQFALVCLCYHKAEKRCTNFAIRRHCINVIIVAMQHLSRRKRSTFLVPLSALHLQGWLFNPLQLAHSCH